MKKLGRILIIVVLGMVASRLAYEYATVAGGNGKELDQYHQKMVQENNQRLANSSAHKR